MSRKMTMKFLAYGAVLVPGSLGFQRFLVFELPRSWGGRQSSRSSLPPRRHL
jgi:hypothetical protein